MMFCLRPLPQTPRTIGTGGDVPVMGEGVRNDMGSPVLAGGNA